MRQNDLRLSHEYDSYDIPPLRINGHVGHVLTALMMMRTIGISGTSCQRTVALEISNSQHWTRHCDAMIETHRVVE